MSVLQQGLLKYLSLEQLQKLQKVRMLIIGAGGLGSNTSMMLVRSGIRHFVLVDHDVVEASNLNRQLYLPEDVGQLKVKALAMRLLDIEPHLNIECYAHKITEDNMEYFFKKADIIVEAVDMAATKAMLCEYAAGQEKIFVTASGIAGLGKNLENNMHVRRLGGNIFCVGDFVSEADNLSPPLAPRVMQAAAMQANLVLQHII